MDTPKMEHVSAEDIRVIALETTKAVMEAQHQQRPPYEKHVQAIVAAILIAMTAWTVNTTNNTAKDVAVLKSDVEAAQEAIRDSAADRWTGTQAANRANDVDRRIGRIEEDIDQIRRRLPN